MKWEKVKLIDICNPKQWKTISTEILTQEGYPVYGANGIIGKYKEFTHESPTVMITCRGATCGNVHISEPFSYINGNAMALDNLGSNVNRKYLYYFLLSYDFKKVISGSAQPQITIQGLQKVTVPLPPLHIQEQIADTLDKADALRKKDQLLLQKYDELAQAVFYDMFGDPVKNEKGWEVKKLSQCVVGKNGIKAGPFGSSLKKEFYTTSGYKIYGQEQVISDDLDFGDYYISEEKYQELESCKISAGDVLISMVGTFGKISVVPDKFHPGIINPRLVKITLDRKKLLPIFFKFVFQLPETRKALKAVSRGGTMDIINAGILKEFSTILPPVTLQEKFIEIWIKITSNKNILKSNQSNNIFDSFIIKNFS